MEICEEGNQYKVFGEENIIKKTKKQLDCESLSSTTCRRVGLTEQGTGPTNNFTSNKSQVISNKRESQSHMKPEIASSMKSKTIAADIRQETELTTSPTTHDLCAKSSTMMSRFTGHSGGETLGAE